MRDFPIVVIGASAGGVEATSAIARALPRRFGAAVFVAVHFPATAPSRLPRILSRTGILEATHPENGERFQAGHIYVSPPGFELLIGTTSLRLTRRLPENEHGPAIDPMFDSAAVSHGNRVIGVLLTGNLYDGTAGLGAIKRHGGVAIVQDPGDALFRSMPLSAIENVNVDHVVPLARIGDLINCLVHDIAGDTAL